MGQLFEVWRCDRRRTGRRYTKEAETETLGRAVKLAFTLGSGTYLVCGPKGNVARIRVGGRRHEAVR